jgi:acyl-[acyl carrier protein]--UDP-N-acetylglucosamine O-acyltransferase
LPLWQIQYGGMSIHPSAIISKYAELGSDVDVGPFAIIEDGVKAGGGCRIRARAHTVQGPCWAATATST